MTVLATVVLLGVLIFVHELGHFLAARSVGVRVERFSIGFGPRLFGFVRGETEYQLSAIPLGGYVKLGGMEDEVMATIEGGDTEGEGEEGREATREPRPGDFDQKPLWARVLVISAGVLMNMAFALGTYTLVAARWGSPELDTTRVAGVRTEALPEGAGPLAQIPTGAVIERVGGREVGHWGELRDAFLSAPDGVLSVEYSQPSGEVTVELMGDEDRGLAFRSIEYWSEPVIDAVQPGRPAYEAGFRPGDRVISAGGQEITSWPRFVSIVQASAGVDLDITIEREGGTIVRTVTPEEQLAEDALTGESRTVGQIGVIAVLPDVTYTRIPLPRAAVVGWGDTAYVTGEILGFLRDLFTGRISARNLGSIVTIGEASGQAAAEGLPFFLSFMALFSVNLAILNLLPIPVLDGGHLLFLGIEAVRGRPLPVEQRLRWSQVGFVVLMGIMVLALGNDILRLVGL